MFTFKINYAKEFSNNLRNCFIYETQGSGFTGKAQPAVTG